MAVSLTPGAALATGVPRTLSTGAGAASGFDVARDGRLLCRGASCAPGNVRAGIWWRTGRCC